MHIIRTAEAFARLVATHPDPELKVLLQAQAERLAEYDEFAMEELAMFVIFEPGDNMNAIGWPLLDGDAFAMPVELIARHCDWYEVTFILSDDGFGLVLYVPINERTNRRLLTACEAALG